VGCRRPRLLELPVRGRGRQAGRSRLAFEDFGLETKIASGACAGSVPAALLAAWGTGLVGYRAKGDASKGGRKSKKNACIPA
jgi:hypothetical protein